jgi:hypothetical protein
MEWLRREHPEVNSLGYLPFCTDDSLFRPDATISESEKCDVSFVGTLWDPAPFLDFLGQINRNDQERALFLEGVVEYQNNYLSDFPSRLAKRLRTKDEVRVRNYLNDFLSSRRRLAVLDKLSDLKLEIYGNATWDAQALLRGDRLYRSFRMEQVETPEQLAALYRRTRVAVSIAHQQAQTGFPIRVFDLFASGVPLVSDPHLEIDELFGAEMYLKADSAEAYSENVRRLLGDKTLAKKMGEAARAEISARHTFLHRLSTAVGQELSQSGLGQVEVVSENFDIAHLSEFEVTVRSLGGKSAGAARSPLQRVVAKNKEIFGFFTNGIAKRASLGWVLLKYTLTAFSKRRTPQAGSSFNRVAKSCKKTASQMLDTLDSQIGYISKEISILRKEEEN